MTRNKRFGLCTHKSCIHCGKYLPIDDFYVCRTMSDGHINTCKECRKLYQKEYYRMRSMDEDFLAKERERAHEKYNRQKLNGVKAKGGVREEMSFQHRNINEKLKRLGYKTAGKDAHHFDYNRPMSVMLLSRRAHRRLHTFLRVNAEDRYCYTLSGERLDTEEKTLMYYTTVLAQFPELHEDFRIIEIE